jgi:hypothetical protein
MKPLRRVVYPLFLVSLALLIIIPQTPLAHAVLTLTSNVNVTCSLNVSCSVTASITANSEIIIIENVITGGCLPTSNWANLTPTDSFGNTYTFLIGIQVSSNNNDCLGAFRTFSTGSGSDLIKISPDPNNAFTSTANVLDFTGFTGFGNTNSFSSASTSGTNNLGFTVSDSSIVIGSAINHVGGVTCGTVTTGSSQIILFNFACQTQSSQGSANGITTSTTTLSAGSYTDTLSWTSGVTTDGFGRILIELKSTGASSSSALVTQCYGNCGSPAITLVNTNSTHSTNFNQSITLFYEFQSNLNGFILNVTTSIAKNYINGQQVSIGIYEANCNVGVTPFTSSCPGALQTSIRGNVNPFKGKTSLVPSTLSVSISQWVGIAVSGVFSGLDLNDTNTSVSLFQTNGNIPTFLGSSAPTGSSKMGLWAFIQGNTIIGPPPPSIVINCGSDFICILIQSVLALTPNNPLLGAIFFGIVYSIVTIVAISAFMWKFNMQGALPSGVYILIFIAWMTFWASLVGAVWFIILEIIATLIIFSSFFGSLASGTFQHKGKHDA